MNAHSIRAGFDEDGSVRVGVLDHQVMIKFQFRGLSKRLGHGRTHRQVRHKMSVHDVDMDHSGASLLNQPDLFAKTCKVRR
jgi:hypothetical protein